MALSMRGQVGELRCGYQVVARLGPWTSDGARVEAGVQAVDEFWLDGRLSLWLTVGRKAWVWRDVQLQELGPPLVARVTGTPEVRDAPG